MCENGHADFGSIWYCERTAILYVTKTYSKFVATFLRFSLTITVYATVGIVLVLTTLNGKIPDEVTSLREKDK